MQKQTAVLPRASFRDFGGDEVWSACAGRASPKAEPGAGGRGQWRRRRRLDRDLQPESAMLVASRHSLTPCLQSTVKMSNTVHGLARSAPRVHLSPANVQACWCRLWVSSRPAEVYTRGRVARAGRRCGRRRRPGPKLAAVLGVRRVSQAELGPSQHVYRAPSGTSLADAFASD
jgi:hypothetical protein